MHKVVPLAQLPQLYSLVWYEIILRATATGKPELLYMLVLTVQIWSFSSCFFPAGSDSKESACIVGDPGSIQGQEDPRKKGMATHSSFLAWRVPWTVEPGGLQSRGAESDMTERLSRHAPWAHTQSAFLLTWQLQDKPTDCHLLLFFPWNFIFF